MGNQNTSETRIMRWYQARITSVDALWEARFIKDNMGIELRRKIIAAAKQEGVRLVKRDGQWRAFRFEESTVQSRCPLSTAALRLGDSEP